MFDTKPETMRIFAPFTLAADVVSAEGPKSHPYLASVGHVREGQDTFVNVGRQRYELINTAGLNVSGNSPNTHVLSEADVRGKVIILTDNGLNISPETMAPA